MIAVWLHGRIEFVPEGPHTYRIDKVAGYEQEYKDALEAMREHMTYDVATTAEERNRDE